MDWFKFEIRKWMDGRIALAGISAQGLFLNLAMRSMLNGGGFAPGEFMAERLHSSPEEYARAMDELVRLKLVEHHEDGTISVPWADKVFKEWLEIAEKRARAGRAGMEKRWGIRQKQVITSVNKCYHEITPDNNQKQNITDIDLDIDNSHVINNTSSFFSKGGSGEKKKDAGAENSYDTLNPDSPVNQRPRNISPPQSADEVRAEAERQGMVWTTAMADDFFGFHASRGWMSTGNVPILDWRKMLRAWFNRADEMRTRRGAAQKFGMRQEYGDTI